MELEKIPSLAAAATFVALSLVVAHDWGYFGVIGNDFQSFYTTYDYVSEMLVSIGPAFVALMVIVAIQAAIARQSNFGQDEKRPSSKWGKFLYDWHLELLWGLGFAFALVVADESNRFAIYMFISMMWLRVCVYVYSHTAFDLFKKTAAGLLFIALPGGMIAMYGLGRDGAYLDLKDTKHPYRLHLKNREVEQTVKILRLLDKGAIIINPVTKMVEFHPRENIALIQRDAPTWERQSYACRHWGLSCTKDSS